MKRTISTLSVLVGILSLSSFIQHFIQSDVFTVANEALEYYRYIAYSIIGLPAGLFGLSFPQELMDFWTLSFVGASAYVKTGGIEHSRFFRNREQFTSKPRWKIWLLFVFGLSGIGVAILLASINPSTYIDEVSEEPQNLSRGAAKNAIYIFGGAFLFFLLNAFAPSI